MVAEKAYRKLTAREERFCYLIAQGENAADAFRKAYNKPGVSYAKQNAQNILKRPSVSARIGELKQPDEKRAYATRAFKRELLLRDMLNPRLQVIDRHRAIDIDNRMSSDYKQTVSVEGEITLAVILKALGTSTALPSRDERQAEKPVEIEATSLPEATPARKSGPLGMEIDVAALFTPPAPPTPQKARISRSYED